MLNLWKPSCATVKQFFIVKPVLSGLSVTEWEGDDEGVFIILAFLVDSLVLESFHYSIILLPKSGTFTPPTK